MTATLIGASFWCSRSTTRFSPFDLVLVVGVAEEGQRDAIRRRPPSR